MPAEQRGSENGATQTTILQRRRFARRDGAQETGNIAAHAPVAEGFRQQR